MSALDIEQAGDILRAYASAVIDSYENGGAVYELDYVVRLEKALKPDSMLAMGWHEAVAEQAGRLVDRAKFAEEKLARIADLVAAWQEKDDTRLLTDRWYLDLAADVADIIEAGAA